MIYLLILVLLLFLELFYFKIADKFNIIDKPNERSSHTRITLRGGGIIFYWGVFFYEVFNGFSYPYFFLGLSLICIISFIDDVHSISSKIRITFHFLAMLLMFYQWGVSGTFSWWYAIISLIFCIGIINVYNFMDGINGITGGYSLVAVLTLLYINTKIVHFIIPSFLYVILLSLLVFNFFNFSKNAKCFAGDVGSVGIAFILLFALGLLALKTGNLYWVILLAVYGVDSILTIVHRLMLHENIFRPHRKHAYQIMANELHIPHVWVSSFYMFLQLLVNLGAIYVADCYKWYYFVLIIFLLSLSYILFIHKNFKKVVFNR